jgi:hypothetical protein
MCAALQLELFRLLLAKTGAIHWIEPHLYRVENHNPELFLGVPAIRIEQPISRYYEYNIAKGEKSGRAAWNKKAFQGINFESISFRKTCI